MSCPSGSMYKQAFLSEMMKRFKGSDMMKAVRKARPQYAPGVTDYGQTLHGSMLKSLEENGAYGAKAIRKGLDKGRMFMEDADTGLGYLAAGKNPNSFRSKMFRFRKRNYVSVRGLGNNPFNKEGYTAYQASRPSLTAPVEAVAATVMPVLGMYKAQEILAGAKIRNKKDSDPEQNNDMQGG